MPAGGEDRVRPVAGGESALACAAAARDPVDRACGVPESRTAVRPRMGPRAGAGRRQRPSRRRPRASRNGCGARRPLRPRLSDRRHRPDRPGRPAHPGTRDLTARRCVLRRPGAAMVGRRVRMGLRSAGGHKHVRGLPQVRLRAQRRVGAATPRTGPAPQAVLRHHLLAGVSGGQPDSAGIEIGLALGCGMGGRRIPRRKRLRAGSGFMQALGLRARRSGRAD